METAPNRDRAEGRPCRPLVVLVDDTRTFRGDVEHVRARSSREGVRALQQIRLQPGAELWLDHDLGMTPDGDLDTISPVVADLERAAFEGDPYPVSKVYVHTSNPRGRSMIVAALRRWGYPSVVVDAADALIEESLRFPPPR